MRVSPVPRMKIAARQSDLARLQAYRVGDALRGRFPDLEIEYQFRASLGDLNQTDPLWKMPEKGVFTEDFLRDLKERTADLVVHSWKDLPTEPRPDTEVVATLPRADVRDLLLMRRDRVQAAMASGRVKILTSSPRRSHNLKSFLETHLPFAPQARAEVSFESVRGNIPTRLKKMIAQDVDGLIVAKAALDRLLAAPEAELSEVQSVIRDVLSRSRFMVLPLTINPTAAAQGALAIEIAKGREDVRAMLAEIHCAETFMTVARERAILAGYGGGCHQKIGVNVLRRPFAEITFLRGLTDAGEVLDRVGWESPQPVVASAKNPDALFPRAGEEAAFFERRALPREAWAAAESADRLWVARESAWPEGFRASLNAIVWTAGLRTWRKLAERGVWVSGSSESLGEEESARLETLLGQAPAWVKLTHEGGAASSDMRICATYRLEPKASAPNLDGRTHFFWMSGSSFERALELQPAIRSGHHACGPGHTARRLRELLGADARISVHLSVEAWRAAVLAASSPR